MTAPVEVTTVSLSTVGVRLIVLEQELQNNLAEINRITSRISELEKTLLAATIRYNSNKNTLVSLQDSVANYSPAWYK